MNNDEQNDLGSFDFDKYLVAEAQSGNRISAIALLREVINTNSSAGLSPIVLGYLSDCFRVWGNTDFSPAEVSKAFNLQRDNHRPSDEQSTRQKHIRALRAYYLMRGRKKGRDQSIVIAARSVHLSESAIRKLLVVDSGGWSAEQGAALLLISKRVRNRCLTPPRKTYQRSR